MDACMYDALLQSLLRRLWVLWKMDRRQTERAKKVGESTERLFSLEMSGVVRRSTRRQTS